MEPTLVRTFLWKKKDFSVTSDQVLFIYLATAIFIIIFIKTILCLFKEKTARNFFLVVFSLFSLAANLFILLSSIMEDNKVLYLFVAIVSINLANSLILIPLIGNYLEVLEEKKSTCFSINLISSIYCISIIGGRLLLELQSKITGYSLVDLDLEKFKPAAYANLGLSVSITTLFYFSYKF